MSKLSKKLILEKLELRNTLRVNMTTLPAFSSLYHRELIGFLNYYYSQVASVNETLNELKRFNIIRYYLVKSYRGKCHALGKPVHGQRTWSNSWSSYNSNLTLRRFISETKRNLDKDKKEEKINFKFIKKKYMNQQKKIKKTEKKIRIWV